MIVDDFDIEWFMAALGPLEANAPLIVDSDAVLPCAIATELFESIPRWFTQVEKTRRLLKSVKSDFRSSTWYPRESSNMQSISEMFGVAITKSRLIRHGESFELLSFHPHAPDIFAIAIALAPQDKLACQWHVIAYVRHNAMLYPTLQRQTAWRRLV